LLLRFLADTAVARRPLRSPQSREADAFGRIHFGLAAAVSALLVLPAATVARVWGCALDVAVRWGVQFKQWAEAGSCGEAPRCVHNSTAMLPKCMVESGRKAEARMAEPLRGS